MDRLVASKDGDTGGTRISLHQLAAAAEPDRSMGELARVEEQRAAEERRMRGNFQDFDLLFEQLTQPPVMALGCPLPNEKYLPKRRAGSCHATHNEQLLREETR